LVSLDARHAAELDELRARHRASREARKRARDAAAGDVAALDQESRRDGAEKRRVLERHARERAPIAMAANALDMRRRALEARRAERSRFYLHALFDTYVLANARGETTTLRALFAPHEPPGGAGDCAAPKLLGEAYRRGLAPVAIAELWWGPPPATGGRLHGTYYPACRGKCGPILGHMVLGLDVEPAPVYERAIDPHKPDVLWEDRWIAIVDKPAGMLSVPGKSQRDSILARLSARYGEAHVVHRLDLDVSGVMIVAKDRATHAALQRLFECREVEKRYIAWLDGTVSSDGGDVDLALRGDLEDRPRQIYDPVGGKPARTRWRVLLRTPHRTRVALYPQTGRAHQLRVHAAHPLGIGVPIVGDPLYGHAGEPLQLHAEAISFVHPHTRERVTTERSAPF
ncbi:MAG TPA: RluA family pseudouridine synthase, partial [Kofleriaceae bacterium]|nr:RluA family pseudouridine synthase [Kofleriaceae bacterium]